MALTVEQVKHALSEKAGNVSQAAKELGVSRTTIYRKIDASPGLKEYLTDKREELVDIAESAIRREVLDGNMTAIIFTLKCQGKERGWVERQEITGKDGDDIGITTRITDAEYNRAISSLAAAATIGEGVSDEGAEQDSVVDPTE